MSLSILILGKFPPTCGQVSTITLWLAIGLQRLGHRVHVCSDALFPAKASICSAVNMPYREYLRDNGIDAHYPSLITERLFFPFSDLTFLSIAATANRLVLKEKPDLIFVNYLEPYIFIGTLLSSEYNIPLLVTHAGTDLTRLGADEDVGMLHSLMLAGLKNFVPKNARAKRLNSGSAHFKPSPYYPPNHIFRPDVDRFGIAEGNLKNTVENFDGEPVFGFFGKFTHGKSIPEIIEAFAIFRKRHASGKLWLLGGSVGGALNINSLIDISGVRDHISVTGFIPNWEMPNFINSCSALFYLKQEYKVAGHVSIIVREALCCQRPIIITEESAEGSVESSKNTLVMKVGKAPSPTELVDAMVACLRLRPSRNPSRATYSASLHEQYVKSWEAIMLDASMRSS